MISEPEGETDVDGLEIRDRVPVRLRPQGESTGTRGVYPRFRHQNVGKCGTVVVVGYPDLRGSQDILRATIGQL